MSAVTVPTVLTGQHADYVRDHYVTHGKHTHTVQPITNIEKCWGTGDTGDDCETYDHQLSSARVLWKHETDD